MEIKASAKYLRISPRKLRLLAKEFVGMTPQQALTKMEFYPQKGREFLRKVVKQAVANAKTNFQQDVNSLRIKSLEVGEGPSFKRIDKSHGARFDRGIIKKRTAHLFLTLESKEAVVKKEKKKNIKKSLGEKGDSPLANLPPKKTNRRKHGTKS
ncbi:MAG: 50S ribosomal protein L22 [Microgenomates group bacterium]